MPDIVINTVVKNPDLSELQKLKKEMKELQSLALNGDGNAAKRLGELKEKMDDVKDATQSLRGTGVERLTNSFSLLSESLRTGDEDKFKVGLKGMGAAMSALPLFFLIEGVKLIVENFDKAVGVFKTVFNVFSDGERRTRALTNELKKLKEANELALVGMTNELKVLEESGASQAQILKLKREINAAKIKELEIDAQLQLNRIQEILDNDSLTESYYRKSAAVLQSLGMEEKAADVLKLIDINKKERAEEAIKKFKEDSIAIQNLKTEQKVEEIKFNKDSHERLLKRNEEFKQADKDLNDGVKANQDKTLDNFIKNNQKQIDEAYKTKDELILNAQDLADQQRIIDEREEQLRKERETQARENDRQEKIKNVKEVLDIESAGLTSLQAISDTYFSIKQANTKKGSAEEEAAAKRQFQINKALQIAAATMNGAQAVTAILSVPDFTFGVLSAIRIAAAIGTTASIIAKISALQFNTSGFASSIAPSTGTTPTTRGGQTVNPSNQSVPQRTQQSTEFDDKGNRTQPFKVVVLGSEIKNVLGQMSKVEAQSKFG